MNKNMNMRRKLFKNTGMNMDENMYIVQYTNTKININIFTDGHIVHESMLVNEYLYEHVDTHIQEGIHEHKYAHNHVHEHVHKVHLFQIPCFALTRNKIT